MVVATKLTDKEKMERLPAVPEGAPFKLKEVTSINYQPHPFTIGAGHVGHASDNFGGMLGEDAIRSAERAGITCGCRGCNVSYDDHTHETAAFIETAHDSPEDLNEVEGLHAYLLECKELAEELGIDGFAFVRAKS